MKATVLILAIAACYYAAAALEQTTYTCGDDTSCYQQCIEFGDEDCE